ncbi:MAG: peroxiredoxin, partial [Gammaproteobacteria bacterium]
MKKTLIGLLIAAIITAPALAALEAGIAAPKFEARASLAGRAFDYSLGDAREAGPDVVFFC